MTRFVALLALALAAVGTPSFAATQTVSFGCEAAKPAVCYFRIFYAPQYNRQVVLPAGMKTDVPGITIGSDRYCAATGKAPVHGCTSKPIAAGYNY